jgi:hypothetical protein
MKTEKEIKLNLEMVNAEITRISEIIENDENMSNEQYTYRNGQKFEEDDWTYNDVLNTYIGQRHILEWMLGA